METALDLATFGVRMGWHLPIQIYPCRDFQNENIQEVTNAKSPCCNYRPSLFLISEGVRPYMIVLASNLACSAKASRGFGALQHYPSAEIKG